MVFGLWVGGDGVGGEGAALRRLERGGSRRKAALRELRRGLVFQRGVQSSMVVVAPVLLAEHFGFQQGGEAFPVQELVPEAAVEALTIGVLPPRRRRGKAGAGNGRAGLPGAM